MIILDFLIYYLTAWFEENRDKLKGSSPVERACYAMALASGMFLFSMTIFVQFKVLKEVHYHFPKIILLFFGIGFVVLYQYIYVTRNRILSINPKKFLFVKKFSDRNRMILSIVLFFILFVSPFIAMVLFIPFGIDKVHSH
jgi:hypothetical protein